MLHLRVGYPPMPVLSADARQLLSQREVDHPGPPDARPGDHHPGVLRGDGADQRATVVDLDGAVRFRGAGQDQIIVRRDEREGVLARVVRKECFEQVLR